MSVATAYAKALYLAAIESKAAPEAAALCDTAQKQLDALVSAVDSSKELQIALHSPVTTAKEKADIVQALANKSGAPTLVTHFLVLLANKGRLSILKQVLDEFNSVRLLAEGGVPGRLVAAEAMSEADIEGLAKAFSKKLGKRVAFNVSTDSSLLAGVKVTVNGVTYDGTLRSQLQMLRDRFVAGQASG